MGSIDAAVEHGQSDLEREYAEQGGRVSGKWSLVFPKATSQEGYFVTMHFGILRLVQEVSLDSLCRILV